MRLLLSAIAANYLSVGQIYLYGNALLILPDAAVPQDVSLTDELETARKASREIFEALPRAPERDSILGALGRMGKSSLKRKIRHRAQLITDSTAGKRFPELVTVIARGRELPELFRAREYSNL